MDGFGDVLGFFGSLWVALSRFESLYVVLGPLWVAVGRSASARFRLIWSRFGSALGRFSFALGCFGPLLDRFGSTGSL